MDWKEAAEKKRNDGKGFLLWQDGIKGLKKGGKSKILNKITFLKTVVFSVYFSGAFGFVSKCTLWFQIFALTFVFN